MGLSNSSKTARNYSSLVTQNQGGGSKKAGLPSTVGHDYWRTTYSKISYGTGSCCDIKKLILTANPNVCVSRSIGSHVHFNTYFKCPQLYY
jgi:hypothetical protein